MLVTQLSALWTSFPSRGGYLSDATAATSPPLSGEAFPLPQVLFFISYFVVISKYIVVTFPVTTSTPKPLLKGEVAAFRLTERSRHKDILVIIETNA